VLNGKRSETPQLNSITATQSFDDFDRYRGDDLLYVPRKKVGVLRGNALNEFRFYHGPVALDWSLQIGEISVKHKTVRFRAKADIARPSPDVSL
jgi:hypothetical protein